MAKTLWEEVFTAGRRYIELLGQPQKNDPDPIQAANREYLSILDKLIETQEDLLEVIGGSQPLPPMTWDTLRASEEGQKQVVEILQNARRDAIKSIRETDPSQAKSSLDRVAVAWRGIAPWDYDRVISGIESTDDDEEEQLGKIARDAQLNSMDRGDMAWVLGCLDEGGQAREHYDSKFIWLVGPDGRSQGSVERKVFDLLQKAEIVRSEARTVDFPVGSHELRHYFLTEAGRDYIDRYRPSGEGKTSFVNLGELQTSMAKLGWAA
ncbi:MAG TPA: hypothetical protein VI756_17755 [Blastocatellia bacterium]